MSTRPAPWNDDENAALVALYFAMLDAATSGESYNKAARIRAIQNGWNTPTGHIDGPLAARSRGSIEAKLMNASAAHRDLGGTPTMDGYGYRCLSNYQAKLKDAVASALVKREGNVAADGGHGLRRMFN